MVSADNPLLMRVKHKGGKDSRHSESKEAMPVRAWPLLNSSPAIQLNWCAESVQFSTTMNQNEQKLIPAREIL
jgi:hypothetical protein